MEPVCPVQIWPKKLEVRILPLPHDQHKPDDQPEVLPEEGQLHGEGQVAQDIVKLYIPGYYWVNIHSGNLTQGKHNQTCSTFAIILTQEP